MKYKSLFIILLISCCAANKNETINKLSNIKPVDTATETITIAPPSEKICPNDMVQVSGEYCTNLEEICLKPIDKLRCKEFKKPTVCKGKTIHMNFCIDTYEYPNQFGQKPKMRNNWYEAKAQCEQQDKRLCVDHEWTQACRGPENLPYPYGYTRDPAACNIDLIWLNPATHTFEQLDRTVPAGSMDRCVSSYGAHDMTGNGDEFVINSSKKPFISALIGGHAYGVRNRCSGTTTVHGPEFSYYVSGFRCCKDIK